MDMGDDLGLGPVPDLAPGTFDGMQFSEAGPLIMQAMRMQRGRNPSRPDLPEIHGIGFIEHFVISREEITSERVHEWPDVIGRPIEPMGVAA